MPIAPEHLHALFLAAQDEELGIVIETNNPNQVQQDLHAYRQSHPELHSVEICIPDIPNHLFLTKKSVDLNE